MQPLRGILYKVLSVCVFLAMASLIKATSGEVPPGEAVFFRSIFALPVIVAWLIMRGELRHGLWGRRRWGWGLLALGCCLCLR